MAGQDGCDVAGLPAVAHDGLAEAGPAASDVGDDPLGDGGPGLLVGCVGHAVHDGCGGAGSRKAEARGWYRWPAAAAQVLRNRP